jgi:hypothetical protein
MTRFPTPRSSGSVTTRATGALDQRAPGQIEYVSAKRVGFECLPEEVRRVVGKALVGEEIAANAEEPLTKRRPDGSHYQVVTAWWASTERLVLIEARRPLELRGERQFAPSGVWSVATTIHRFAPGVVAERSRWLLDPKASTPLGAPAPRAIDVLDVLPPRLVAPLRGGSSAAWQRFRPEWANETIVALRIDAGRLRVMKAERNASSKYSLAFAQWHSTTIDAAIAETRELGGRVLRLPRRSQLRERGGQSPEMMQ